MRQAGIRPVRVAIGAGRWGEAALSETSDLIAKDPIACDLWKKGFVRRLRELARAGD